LGFIACGSDDFPGKFARRQTKNKNNLKKRMDNVANEILKVFMQVLKDRLFFLMFVFSLFFFTKKKQRQCFLSRRPIVRLQQKTITNKTSTSIFLHDDNFFIVGEVKKIDHFDEKKKNFQSNFQDFIPKFLTFVYVLTDTSCTLLYSRIP